MQGGLILTGIEKQSGINNPLVSVITVVYNGAKHLEQTINSVLTQSYKNIEYIIIDGGSTDETVDIIKRYEDKIDYWQSERDGGIYFAMNKGISLAKGELIGILNADDFYLPDTIEKIITTNKTFQADIYYGDMQYITENAHKLSVAKPDITKMNEMPAIFHPTCFVRKSVYDKAGVFDTQYKISADYDFLLRCLRKNFSFYYIPEVFTCFRLGGMSGSCASNIEGYKIMKVHKTGHHKKIILRTIKCYVKTFIKKIIHLKRSK
jgi:glycosyltransferase involved in cell wall biosynthesis